MSPLSGTSKAGNDGLRLLTFFLLFITLVIQSGGQGKKSYATLLCRRAANRQR